MKEFYSIGEMAKLNYISPHTLRYYDKIGLLKPSYTNEDTGYRYYSYKDFLLLDAIQYLRHFGMSLEEIKEQFNSRTVSGTLMLYEKQLISLEEDLKALKNIKKRLVHNIDNLRASRNKEFNETPEIVSHGTRYAIIINDAVTSDAEYEVAIRKLSNRLYKNHFQYMGDFIGIKNWTDIDNHDYARTELIGNMCTERPGKIKTKAFPAGKYLRLCYTGPTENIGTAYQKLTGFINEHQLKTADEILEIYAVDYIDTANPDEYVTIIEAGLV